MRNYVQVFAVLVREHLRSGAILDVQIGPYATYEEFEAEFGPLVASLANSFDPASFEVLYYPMQTIQGSPRIFIELNKANVAFLGRFGQAALSSALYTQDSPRETWSHGH